MILSFAISSFLVRNDSSLGFFEFLEISWSIQALFLLLAFTIILIFEINNLYKINVILSRSAHFTALLKSLYYSALGIVIVSLLIQNNSLMDSRLIIFVFVLTSLPFWYLLRVEILRSIYLILHDKQFNRNIVIVGAGKSGKLLAAKLIFENPIGLSLVGFIDDTVEKGFQIIGTKNVLGNTGEIREIKKAYNVDEILIAIDKINYERLLEILDVCHELEVDVKVVSELFNIVSKKIYTERYADVPIIGVTPRYNTGISIKLKRFFDVLFSSIGLLFLSPLLVFIALAIKFGSPGPIFFRQIRVGRNGQNFEFLKFRSMTVAGEEDEERKEKMIEFIKNGGDDSGEKVINESRITTIGKYLRATSLDELPQLINVIKGDMSLVGPRPCLPYEYEHYDTWQKRRTNTLPGLTGVWQVWGRSSVSFKDSIVLDLYYINNMSPWLDLQLILKTVPVMIFSKGGK